MRSPDKQKLGAGHKQFGGKSLGDAYSFDPHGKFLVNQAHYELLPKPEE